jgi:hypothetical protein
MVDRLEELLKAARRKVMTPEERWARSISVVVGNANVERDSLARGTVKVVVPGAEANKTC